MWTIRWETTSVLERRNSALRAREKRFVSLFSISSFISKRPHIWPLAFYKSSQTAAKGTAEPWDVCADGSFPRCPNGNRDTCPFHIRKCADRSLTISSFFWKQGHKSFNVLLENVQIIDPFYCGETFWVSGFYISVDWGRKPSLRTVQCSPSAISKSILVYFW